MKVERKIMSGSSNFVCDTVAVINSEKLSCD